MAVAMYSRWERDGRPITPCQPIREIVNRLKVAYPLAAKENLFSWYANEAHYQAEPPEDHTPFSSTGWPLPSPYPYVFATDVMHRPDLGVDCFDLFAYWIAEARAGRMPWLKYIIWQGQSWAVYRGNFTQPKPASGHGDHIHLSTRTDCQNTSLGAWSLTPTPTITEGDDDMWTITAPSKTVYLVPGDLVDGRPVAIPQVDWDKVQSWQANGVRNVVSTVEPKAPYWFVAPVGASWPPAVPPVEVDLSDEDLAKIAAAAKEGAQAGAPTHDELVQASFEGAQRAEKE